MTWKAVPGFEGHYEVSDAGGVRRFLRGRRAIAKYGPHRVLSPKALPSGYRQVVLSKNNVQTYRYVHRLVLEAFVGPCPEGMLSCHGNGDKSDNRLANLRWDTQAANLGDARRHGTLLVGEANTSAKLTVECVRAILASSEQGAVLALRYGVSRSRITRIRNRQSWCHVHGNPEAKTAARMKRGKK